MAEAQKVYKGRLGSETREERQRRREQEASEKLEKQLRARRLAREKDPKRGLTTPFAMPIRYSPKLLRNVRGQSLGQYPQGQAPTNVRTFRVVPKVLSIQKPEGWDRPVARLSPAEAAERINALRTLEAARRRVETARRFQDAVRFFGDFAVKRLQQSDCTVDLSRTPLLIEVICS